MFLLVSVRHVEAHPGELQHGVSIQISISLDKTFLRISRIRNIPLTWILARVFVYVPPFISQILDLIYWTVLIFILNGVTLKTSNTCSWQTYRMTNYNWFIDFRLPDCDKVPELNIWTMTHVQLPTEWLIDQPCAWSTLRERMSYQLNS